MVWQDLLLDRWIDGPALGRALATVFDVEQQSVLVVDDVANLTLEVVGVKVLAERTRRGGQFPLQLSVYVRDEAVWRRVQEFDEIVRLVRELCALLRSSCLITGDAQDPEEDFLIRPTGDLLRVTLDHDELTVVASEPVEMVAARPST